MAVYAAFPRSIRLLRACCSRVTHPCAGRRQKYCYSLAAPRLACVKPAASVHPEPGSNSSLYIFYLYSSSTILTSSFLKRNLRSNVFRVALYISYFLSSMLLVSIIISINCRSFPERDCKGTPFFFHSKSKSKIFAFFLELFFSSATASAQLAEK